MDSNVCQCHNKEMYGCKELRQYCYAIDRYMLMLKLRFYIARAMRVLQERIAAGDTNPLYPITESEKKTNSLAAAMEYES